MRIGRYTITAALLCIQSFNVDSSDDCRIAVAVSVEHPCVFHIDHKVFYVFPSGKIRVLEKTGAKEMRVALPDNFYIEMVKYEAVRNVIVFSFDITDQEAGSSIVVSYDTDKNNIGWQAEIGAFNVSVPLIESNTIYVGALGTIVKLDRNTGSVIWRHDGLYKKDTQTFMSFSKPIREGKFVRFVELGITIKDHGENRDVIVDDSTGVIVDKR